MKIIFLTVLSLCIFSYARSGSDTKYETFIVHVDSISHSGNVRVGDTIKIGFYGTIGTDGCHSFSHFEEYIGESSIELTVWGKRSMDEICPAVMVYLEGRQYCFLARRVGKLQIRINQPDSTILKDSLKIVGPDE